MLVQPGLEHQNRPQRAGPVAAFLQMLLPAFLNGLGTQVALLGDLGQQVFGPRAEVSAQPVADGYGEASFYQDVVVFVISSRRMVD
jgi:hypothetical protein